MLKSGLSRLRKAYPAIALSEACQRSRTGQDVNKTSNLVLGRRFPAHGLSTAAEELDVIQMEAGLSRIDGYDDKGFVVNGAYVEGALLCSGALTTMWKVKDLASMTPTSLSILRLIKPPPDLIVVGCGARIRSLPAQTQRWLEDQEVAIECIDTRNAISTFNILNQEGRKVVAALLPWSSK